MSWGGTVDGAALVVTGLGLVVGLLVLTRTRQLAPALAAFLLMLTAAGLLRLAAAPNLTRALGAGGVLGVRQLVTAGLRDSTPVAGLTGRIRKLTRRAT